ncbi:MAG: aldehyde dehydrogenase family protein [Cyanobacteria bacterium]|nr:aldehyde dehydrogenase family protein [Cyanobacteriota bacterium]
MDVLDVQDLKPLSVLESLNPRTGQVLETYPVTGSESVSTWVKLAHKVFPKWSETTFDQRRKLLRWVADEIVLQQDSLALEIALESGKTVQQAIEGDLLPSVNLLRYYAKQGEETLKPQPIVSLNALMMGRMYHKTYQPKGVVGIISPWNYPFAIPLSGIATALMAGNCVVLKPSELTPGVAKSLVSLFKKALKHLQLEHLEHCLILIQGDGATGKALVSSNIDHLIFTGSATVGESIRQYLSTQRKTFSFELGGSDPMICLPGCDLDAVTSFALWGRFINAGQACAAVKRVFVQNEQFEQFLSLLKSKISLLKPSFEPLNGDIGPLVSASQLLKINQQIQLAKEEGAQCWESEEFLCLTQNEDGYYCPPVLISHIPKDAHFTQQEYFGPVLMVFSYESIDEAIKMANDTQYGLGASVFGPTLLAQEVSQKLQAGMVAMNDLPTLGYALAEVPWQGWKQSGPGVSHSLQALLDVTQMKVVSSNFLFEIPFFRKPFWHFGAQSTHTFAKALLTYFASEKWGQKMNPKLMLELFKNRSSQKY